MSSPPPGFESLYVATAALYGVYLIAEIVRPGLRRWPLALAVLAQGAGVVLRGIAIEAFPLTNKFESFYAFSLALFVTCLCLPGGAGRVHRLALFAVGAAFYAATTLFNPGVFYPPPLMQTLWYPLHVPASFAAYALWTSAAAAGLASLLGAGGERERRAIEDHAFWGWCVFGVSMIFGGAWGLVAWGAYFLWDPKVVWSAVIWLYYSGYVHLRYWPAGARPRVKAALALVGFAAMMVAYVGTSFFFSGGSHAFSQR